MWDLFDCQRERGLFLLSIEAPAESRKYYSRLMSHVSGWQRLDCLIVFSLPSPVTRQNISFRQYLGGGGCGWVCGCQVNNWICRRVKKRERCSNPSPANQVARMQISTNQTPIKSSTLLSEACRSLRNKQIYPWERGGIVLCSVIIQEEF